MTDAEILAFGGDMALALRARGQFFADQVSDQKTKDFLQSLYEDAAEVVELRTQLRRAGDFLKQKYSGEPRHG